MSKHGIIGTPESPHYKGPDRTHPFQKDGTSSASTIYEARQGGLELLKKLGEQQKPMIGLLNVLNARAKREQTYLEILEEHGKTTGFFLPINSDIDKMLYNDFVLTDDPLVKENLARAMIDIYTMPKN